MDHKRIEPLYEAAALRGSVAELAQQMSADFEETEPLLLAILGGSLIFLADLVRAIDRPVRYELIQVGYSEGEKLRQHGASEVRFAALIDMPYERKTEFTVDYSAFTTQRDGILVGYGLKHEGRYGNLPYIGRLPSRA
jgi:hypoxanthine phosphoribosyltransferase